MTEEKPLSGRVVLVTGASRGIGFAAAKEVARRGAHVIAVARTVGGLEDLDDEIQALGSSATLVPLDLKDGEAIDRLGAAIFERWGQLDGIVGNAGLLGTISPVPHLDPAEWDDVFAINVTANFRILRAMDLLLRQSESARVVFVSSGAARACKPYWGVYSSSKAALDGMIKTYAGEMVSTSVNANVFYPGPVRTGMRAKAMPGEDPETLPHPDDIAPRLVDMLAPDFAENGQIYDIKTGGLTPL